MLNLKLADVYIDLTMDTRKYAQSLAYVRASLTRIPTVHNITLNLNRATATSNLNLFMQQLRAAQGLTRFNLNVPRPRASRAGAGFGGGTGQFAAGLGQGLGLPFATSPQMMAGQVVGGAVQGLAQGGVAAVKVAVDLQSRFSVLQRVTGATADQIANLKDQLFELAQSRGNAAPIDDIIELATVGGRMGVADKGGIAGLLEFTRAMAQVKTVITDIPAEELANRMARVLTNFKLGTEYAKGLGAAIVAMDEKSTASAKDILDITTRISGRGLSAGMTIEEVVGLSSILKDVGLSNEVAGTAFGAILDRMASKSSTFADKIGMDAKAFEDAYRQGPLVALKMIIDHLNKIGDTVERQQFLADLGFKSQRQSSTLLQLGNALDQLPGRVAEAKTQFETAQALTAGVELTAGNAASAFARLDTSIKHLADTLAGPYLGAITNATDRLAGFVEQTRKAGQGGGFDAAIKGMAVGLPGGVGPIAAVLGWLFGGPPAAGAGGPPGGPKLPALPARPKPFVGPPNLNADLMQTSVGDLTIEQIKALQAFNQDRMKSIGEIASMAAGAVPKLDLSHLIENVIPQRSRLGVSMSSEDINRQLQASIFDTSEKTNQEQLKEQRKQTKELEEVNKALRDRPIVPGILA